MREIITKAWRLGRLACKNNKSLNANPYKDEELRDAWESGYWSYDVEDTEDVRERYDAVDNTTQFRL